MEKVILYPEFRPSGRVGNGICASCGTNTRLWTVEPVQEDDVISEKDKVLCKYCIAKHYRDHYELDSK